VELAGGERQGRHDGLPEWEAIALNGRRTYIVFDSDVMENAAVHQAMARLKTFLEAKGAEVSVIYLPSGPSGVKVGLDDYLVSGHGRDDLLALASSELRPLPAGEDEDGGDIHACPYRVTASGMVWDKPSRDGTVAVPLANFTATITGDVTVDDGAETSRSFHLVARLGARVAGFDVPSHRFASMDWATEHLGAQAIVYPGMGAKDHTRVAIQMLSDEVVESRVYAHTGWRQLEDGAWVYLHGGGALGSAGPVAGVEVALSGSLAGYVLPEPPTGSELVEAIRASLAVIDLAPDMVTVPLLGATYRAPLGPVDAGVALVGPTGAGKSELAALAQQHYGTDLDARHLPGSWSATANALEELAFVAKDALLVVDDFAPAGSPVDVSRLHAAAERLYRAQGNHSGRGRMRADGSLRATRPPRGLILSTGEDAPRGQSVRARVLVVEMSPGDLDWEALSAAQGAASAGYHAQAMAGFLAFLAPSYGDLAGNLASEVHRLRAAATGSATHRRTPEVVANLAAGWGTFLAFARCAGAITEREHDALWLRVWSALGDQATAQAAHLADAEPARRFIDLLGSALGSGKAHLAGTDGGEPTEAGRYGWRNDDSMHRRPMGDRVGWVDADGAYLDLTASLGAAQAMARDTGEALAVSARTLLKRLHERGYLASTGSASEGRQTHKVRRVVGEVRREVVHVSLENLAPSTSVEPDQPDHEGIGDPDSQVRGQVRGQVFTADGQVSRANLTTEKEPPPAPLPSVVRLVRCSSGERGTTSEERGTPFHSWSGSDGEPDHSGPLPDHEPDQPDHGEHEPAPEWERLEI